MDSGCCDLSHMPKIIKLLAEKKNSVTFHCVCPWHLLLTVIFIAILVIQIKKKKNYESFHFYQIISILILHWQPDTMNVIHAYL